MALRLVYRSYGGENAKGRPPYYSKLLALVSAIRAVERTDAEIVFVNDGPIPADRAALMAKAGEVVELPSVGMRGSYLAALRLATSGRWSEDDVVWFGEDDYLYLPDSFAHLEAAATAMPEVDYFALYGLPAHGAAPGQESVRPAGWEDRGPWTVDGQRWSRIQSTTSSLGARVGALVEDRGIFRLCMLPHRNQLRDHDTCLVLQGARPYRYPDLARRALGLSPGGPRERVRQAVFAPFLLSTNLRAHRRPGRRRIMAAAQPNLAAHMELGWLPDGYDWAAVADDTLAWAAERGLPLDDTAA